MERVAARAGSARSGLRVDPERVASAGKKTRTPWVRRLRGRTFVRRATGGDGDFEGQGEWSLYHRTRSGGRQTGRGSRRICRERRQPEAGREEGVLERRSDGHADRADGALDRLCGP